MEKELIDFLNWVWKYEMLNSDAPPEVIVKTYIKSINSDAPFGSRDVNEHEQAKEVCRTFICDWATTTSTRCRICGMDKSFH